MFTATVKFKYMGRCIFGPYIVILWLHANMQIIAYDGLVQPDYDLQFQACRSRRQSLQSVFFDLFSCFSLHLHLRHGFGIWWWSLLPSYCECLWLTSVPLFRLPDCSFYMMNPIIFCAIQCNLRVTGGSAFSLTTNFSFVGISSLLIFLFCELHFCNFVMMNNLESLCGWDTESNVEIKRPFLSLCWIEWLFYWIMVSSIFLFYRHQC